MLQNDVTQPKRVGLLSSSSAFNENKQKPVPTKTTKYIFQTQNARPIALIGSSFSAPGDLVTFFPLYSGAKKITCATLSKTGDIVLLVC